MSSAAPVMQRPVGLGGSDCAAALGLDPKVTPFALYRRKRDEMAGRPQKFEETEEMFWGKLHEPTIIAVHEERTGRKFRRQVPVRHGRHPWMFGHIDAIPEDGKSIIEVKTAGHPTDKWGEPGTSEVPIRYLAQVNHYLALVPDAQECELVTLFRGNELAVYRIPRNDDHLAGLVELEEAFWELVVTGQPPPAMTPEEAVDRWPAHIGTRKELDEEAVQHLERFEFLRAQRLAAGKEEDNEKVWLQNYLEDAEYGVVGRDVRCTWKEQPDNRLDQQQLKKLFPDAYRACYVNGKTRRFLPKEPKT